MANEDGNMQSPWKAYYGPNMGYVQEQYELFTLNPESVDAEYRTLFEQWGPPPEEELTYVNKKGNTAAPEVADIHLLKKAVTTSELVQNIRKYGHLKANIDPLGTSEEMDTTLLSSKNYGLSEHDLKSLPASIVWENADPSIKTALDAIHRLTELYTGSIAFEFSHIQNEEERKWLYKYVETGQTRIKLSEEEKKGLLKRLVEVEQFEQFLHKNFVGQKWFSIEGNDMLVPMLDSFIDSMMDAGSSHILMGMAHRGRLNVLTHVLGKPYGQIFSKFHQAVNKDLKPSESFSSANNCWTGDVKYHLGATRYIQKGEAIQAKITLANNPSHLEYVNPVIQGFARAAQEDRRQPGYPKQDVTKAAGILMHGDAAFPGEGIVAESLNLKGLKGYQSGGIVHIIVNNRVGFTTDSDDSRSTLYSSDLAKGYEIPIIHVNADDPEACIAAIRFASAYRNRYKKDFLVDLIGYRRYGHNETDDPETTQPIVYSKVKKHALVTELYAKSLANSGMSSDLLAQYRSEVQGVMKQAYEEAKRGNVSHEVHNQVDGGSKRLNPSEKLTKATTAVSIDKLREMNAALLKWPEGFKIYPKLARILQRRQNALDDGEKVDWSLAETLAFASILAEGKPIRMSGQDAQRATFAHRNLVLHDTETGKELNMLHHLPQAKASFALHNSPLSEESVLGFEYGYNVYSPETLVIWEAQFGDFANCAQVVFDQFISSARSKWSQNSSLVMLLPHASEGQGPEHTSARLERFLQMCADDNWFVANVTSSAQYFHLLRRQAALTDTPDARPLVIMSPKSLIRNPRVASPAKQLSEGNFQLVLEQPNLGLQSDRVERVLLCSGKIAIDLEEAIDKDKEQDWSWLHIIRVEQLYPFPEQEIKRILARFRNLKELVWTQEETKNMGAWTYMEPKIRALAPEGVKVEYAGRVERSSPATGFQYVHLQEQQQILAKVLKQNSKKNIPLGR